MDLFKTNDDKELLDEDRSMRFHHIVAKLLFVAKRARPDIDLVISYLCRRVSRNNIHDWEKLSRLLRYINGTLNMKRTIGARNMEVLRTWVDASYATHDDRKSHTGGCYSLGTGLAHHKTSKQKINTRSSTEAELVGASDYVAYTVWITGFRIQSSKKASTLADY